MNHSVINQELALDWPESFHELSMQELKDMSISAPDEGFAIRNNDNHMLVSIHWKKLPFFLSLMADPKENMKSTEAMMRKGLEKNDYELIETTEKHAAGETLPGFVYEYTVRDSRQYSEALFLKHKNHIYAIYCYGRKDHREEDEPVFEDMLRSLQFVS